MFKTIKKIIGSIITDQITFGLIVLSCAINHVLTVKLSSLGVGPEVLYVVKAFELALLFKFVVASLKN